MGRLDHLEYEKIIAEGMKDVASELRLVDAHNLVAMIQSGQEGAIADVVNSSTELFFKSGTLQYALSSNCSVRWNETPVVQIDMEFLHDRVSAYFRLVIAGKRAGVDLIRLFVEEDLERPEQAERLARAIANARIPPAGGRGAGEQGG